MPTPTQKTTTKKRKKLQEHLKTNRFTIVIILFFTVFNLLSIGDIWKYTLEPAGLHLWLENIFPGLYQHNERLFIRYTHDGEKQMILYCWNVSLGFIISILAFIIFWVKPQSQNYLLGSIYPNKQNFLQNTLGPLVGFLMIYGVLKITPASTKISVIAHYSGFISLIITGAAFTLACSLIAMTFAKLIQNQVNKTSKQGTQS